MNRKVRCSTMFIDLKIFGYSFQLYKKELPGSGQLQLGQLCVSLACNCIIMCVLRMQLYKQWRSHNQLPKMKQSGYWNTTKDSSHLVIFLDPFLSILNHTITSKDVNELSFIFDRIMNSLQFLSFKFLKSLSFEQGN